MRWESVIGLEIHAELATRSKIFCGCSTAFGAPPNSHCCPVCMGLPGALPVLNKKAVEYAVRAGLALGCSISECCAFDRKNYFYPDLPKGYQISQLYSPLCLDGMVELPGENGEKKQVRILEIHMEEDAGKLIHDPDGGPALVDFNRSGLPLIEIVSAPDLRSAGEALAFLQHIKSVLEYLGVSDCKMEEGSLRADLNLSVRPAGSSLLGTRTEMKNLSSFRAVSRAIQAESHRQIQLLESGGAVLQESRRWDETQNRSFPMRNKESARDYRYFPEPDLPPLELDKAWIAVLRAQQPELAHEKCARYTAELGLPSADAALLCQQKALADFFEAVLAQGAPPKSAANWILGPLMHQMKVQGLSAGQLRTRPEMLAQLIALVEAGQINRGSAVQVMEALFDGGTDPAAYIQRQGLGQVTDSLRLEQAIQQVLTEHAALAAQYRAGSQKVFSFLVGQSMRALQGRADPRLVNQILKRLLESD